MKNNLIVKVSNSSYWSVEEKDTFEANIIKHFKEYKSIVLFTDEERTTFTVLEYPKLINWFKNTIECFKYIFK